MLTTSVFVGLIYCVVFRPVPSCVFLLYSTTGNFFVSSLSLYVVDTHGSGVITLTFSSGIQPIQNPSPPSANITRTFAPMSGGTPQNP